MTPDMFTNILLGIIAFLIGWFIRDNKKTTESHGQRIGALELAVVGTYVTRSEFDSKITAMFGKLDKIETGVIVCQTQHTGGMGCVHCNPKIGVTNA